MELQEFIDTYLNKPRCEKVIGLLKMLGQYEYFVSEQESNDKGTITFFIDHEDPGVTHALKMEVTNYQSSWVLKVKDNLHDIYERAVGTTKIDVLIDKLTKAFEVPRVSDDEEEKEVTDNDVINDVYNSIIKNYNSLVISFKHICSDMNNMFSDTLKLFNDEVKKIELSHENTVLDLLKIFKYFYNRFQGYQFEKVVVLNTIATKTLEYIGKVHAEEPMSKDVVRITAESNPICYAHVLPFYGGKCHRLHGHNGKLSITMIATKDFCKKRPMIVSYGFLKGFLKYVDSIMDHTTLIHINDKNVNLELIDGTDLEVQLVTEKIDLKMTEGYNLIPNIEGVKEANESTSEMTLINYVIPLFKIYLLDFICKEGIDNTELTMFGLDEQVTFEFKWGETDSTYCTISFSI